MLRRQGMRRQTLDLPQFVLFTVGPGPGFAARIARAVMMSFAHLSRCRRADEISSESEVLKSTGSLPVAILELAARPAFLNAEDLSLFFWDSLAIRPGGSYVPGG